MRKTHYTEVDVHKLDAHERPKYTYEYTVTGTGQFPFDMLRYDAAWPATSQDATAMGLGFHEAYAGQRTIKLRSYREPTIARWDSFTWAVRAPDWTVSSNTR